jgi:hypothetical protein
VETVRSFYLDRLAEDRWRPVDANSVSSRPLQYYWRGNSGSMYELTITLTTEANRTIIRIELFKHPQLD